MTAKRSGGFAGGGRGGCGEILAIVGLLAVAPVLVALLFQLVGAGALMLATAPVIVTGWRFGLRRALGVLAPNIAVTLLLWSFLGRDLRDFPETGGVGILLSVVLAVGAARLRRSERDQRDLVTELRREAERRRSIEQALREERDLSRAYLHAVDLFLLVLDREGRVILINQAGEQCLGRSADEVAGTDWFAEYVPMEEQSAVRAAFDMLRRGIVKPVEFFEHHVLTRHGARRLFSWHNAVFFDTDQEPLGIVSVGEDVTDRQAAQRALLASEERLRTICDSARDAIVMMGPAGDVVFWNPAAEKIFGWSAREVHGRNVHELLAPEEIRRRHRQRFPVFQETGQGWAIGKTVELAGCRRDGTEFPIEISLAGVEIDGQWNAIGILRDISERKAVEAALVEAKQQAEQAARAKADFLANMSHEIRTPMNAVAGMVNLLEESSLTSEQREMVRVIRVGADSLLSIIDGILDFSKIEVGMVKVEQAPIDVFRCVESAVALVAAAARDKGIEVVTRKGDDVPAETMGDSVRLGQVLTNLLSNAVKFTERGRVTVSVAVERSAVDQPMLHFVVRDTGIGISVEQRRQIFQPFVQADPSTTRRYGGTGLGLSISSRLVELMGGRIWVESAGQPGAGSGFHFTVPMPPRDRSAVVATAPAGDRARPADTDGAVGDRGEAPAPVGERGGDTRLAAGTGRKDPSTRRSVRILLAEDNVVNCQVALMMLESLGYPVDVVENGRQAVAAVAREFYDLVLMDVQMPEIDGLEATRQIRALPINGRTPTIIAMTANATEEERLRCAAVGMDGFVPKPVSRDDLRRVVMDCLLETARPVVGQ